MIVPFKNLKNLIKMNRCLLGFYFLINFYGCTKTNSPPVLPSVTISDITKAEGNSGNTPFTFVVKLDKSTTNVVTVNFTVTDGSAKRGDDYDVATSSPITFASGETQKDIVVNVKADDIKEVDEDFTIQLSNTTGANIASATAKGIIQNDDTRVSFSNAGYSTPLSYPGTQLVWSDEFDGTTLDANNWSFEIGDGCPSLCGWGNNELQDYTNSSENLFLQNGSVIIEAKKQVTSSSNYTSARITTQGKKSFKFGRIDIRAISPKGNGIWPALWMMPQDNVYGSWPNSGEIDIMEIKGNDTKTAYQTIHYGPGPPSTFVSKSYTSTNGSFSDSFHVYSLMWTMDTVRMLIDNVEINKLTKTDLTGRTYPFNEKFFFNLNTAVGGNFLPGPPDTITNFPQWLIVDYVRVFQL